jgi:hypothetical protein
MSAKRSQRDLQTAIKVQSLDFASTMPARLSKEADRARIVALVCQSYWSPERVASYYQTSSLSRVYRWMARVKNGLPLTDLPRSGRSLKIPPKTLEGVQQDVWQAVTVHALGRQNITQGRGAPPHHYCLESSAPSWESAPQTDTTIQTASW